MACAIVVIAIVWPSKVIQNNDQMPRAPAQKDPPKIAAQLIKDKEFPLVSNLVKQSE